MSKILSPEAAADRIAAAEDMLAVMRNRTFTESICDHIQYIVQSAIEWHRMQSERRRTSSKRIASHAAAVDNIVFNFRGYPNTQQAHELSNNIGGCRFLWNRMKADRDACMDAGDRYTVKTPAMYKNESELVWLRNLDSYALCNVQLRHEAAYNDYFNGNRGKPKFKKKHLAKASYTTNKDKRCNNILLDGNMLTLPKITGPVRVICHRKIPNGMTLKSVTVTHEKNDTWTFAVLFEREHHDIEVWEDVYNRIGTPDFRHTGLDMSLPHMYIDANGHIPSYELNGVTVTFEKQFLRLQDKLAREQRKLAHKEPHSANYRKQAIKVAKLYSKVKNRRHDFICQIASRLAKQYNLISIEDLNIAAMKRSLKFGKSVSDNCWGEFVSILERKCLEYGCFLVRVDKWFPSSKLCSVCGHVHQELKLNDRIYICPKCGNVIGRDKQAADNLDREGLRIINEAYLKPQAA